MNFRYRVLPVGILLVLLLALTAVGCAGGVGSKGLGTQQGTDSRASAGSEDGDEESIADADVRTEQEKCAAIEAIRCAEDANTGSTFKAVLVKIGGGWARVAVEEANVPRDEAVGFSVFLRVADDGKWEVIETGSHLTEGDLPGAPPEIFGP